MSLAIAARSAHPSSFGARFQQARGQSTGLARQVSAGSNVIDIARPPAGRAAPIGKPRAPLVPSRAPKSDSAGAVISGALPSAAMLLGARVVDKSKLGQAVKDFTGVAELSDFAAGLAILGRATGLDAGMPGVRANGTRLIIGKMHEWALRVGDATSDVMTDWTTYNAKKAAKDKADEAKAAPAPAAKEAEVSAAV